MSQGTKSISRKVAIIEIFKRKLKFVSNRR